MIRYQVDVPVRDVVTSRIDRGESFVDEAAEVRAEERLYELLVHVVYDVVYVFILCCYNRELRGGFKILPNLKRLLSWHMQLQSIFLLKGI